MSGLISVDEAYDRIKSALPERRIETRPLAACLGLQLASDLPARVSRPPANVSAMDGYGVRLADVSKAGAVLKVIGESPAGTPFQGTVGPGEAVRLFTGSVIPQGANHVVIQEDAVRDGDRLTCNEAYSSAEHVRRAGLDFAEGEMVLAAGSRIDAAALAVAAAANHASLDVYAPLRVGLLANGDELRSPGSTLGPGQIVNSNPPGLAALIQAWGGEPVDLGVASDNVESIKAHIARAENIDIFVPVGGASVGDHDHMRSAFAEMGFEPVFEKIAVKPGKPTWFSRRANQRVLGLPGNPASAFVCAHLFLRALLTGEFATLYRPARLAADFPANGPREAFLRAELTIDETGALRADPASNQDSSLIRPFLACNGLVRRPGNAPACLVGQTVDVMVIGALA